MDSGAIFDNARENRFVLWRIWDTSKPSVAWICLNPSSADEVVDDPTIRRVLSLSKDLGFGSLYMLNVFSYISTDSSKLKKGNLRNLTYLKEYGNKCNTVVFAWGSSSKLVKDKEHILNRIFPNARCLGHNKDGNPKHPLFIKNPVALIKYMPEPPKQPKP